MKLLQLLKEIKVAPPTQLPFDPNIAVLDLEGLLSGNFPIEPGRTVSYIGHDYGKYNYATPLEYLRVYLKSDDNKFYELIYHPDETIDTNYNPNTELGIGNFRDRKGFQSSPDGFPIHPALIPSDLIY
jgi:hypothetical protein